MTTCFPKRVNNPSISLENFSQFPMSETQNHQNGSWAQTINLMGHHEIRQKFPLFSRFFRPCRLWYALFRPSSLPAMATNLLSLLSGPPRNTAPPVSGRRAWRGVSALLSVFDLVLIRISAIKHFVGRRDCGITQTDIYLAPWPMYPKVSPFCKNRAMLLEALSGGGRHGWDEPFVGRGKLAGAKVSKLN